MYYIYVNSLYKYNIYIYNMNMKYKYDDEVRGVFSEVKNSLPQSRGV